MFTAAKNAMAAKAAQLYVNRQIGRYGQLQDLKIDSAAGSVEAVCLLHGEKEPIAVKIGKYEIVAEGEKHFLHASACSSSREWVQHLLEDHLAGKRVEIPAWAATALK